MLQMQRTVSIGHGTGGRMLKVTFSSDDMEGLMGGSPKLGETSKNQAIRVESSV